MTLIWGDPEVYRQGLQQGQAGQAYKVLSIHIGAIISSTLALVIKLNWFRFRFPFCFLITDCIVYRINNLQILIAMHIKWHTIYPFLI